MYVLFVSLGILIMNEYIYGRFPFNKNLGLGATNEDRAKMAQVKERGGGV